MKRNKEVIYHIEAMEKLPEKWSYLHEVLKTSIEESNKSEIEIKIYYIPIFKYFVIKESSVLGDLINTRIFNYPLRNIYSRRKIRFLYYLV